MSAKELAYHFSTPLTTEHLGEIPPHYKMDVDSDEKYFIGSEVGAYLRLFRGMLYKTYPVLWRMLCSPQQRLHLISQAEDKHKMMQMSNITIVKYSEIMDIMKGDGDSYRSGPPKVIIKGETLKFNFPTPVIKKSDAPSSGRGRASRSAKRKEQEELEKAQMESANTWSSSSIRHHLDPVPFNTAVTHVRNEKKMLRTYPSFSMPSTEIAHDQAKKIEDLIPIRLDMEIDGQKLRDVFTWNKNEKVITPEIYAEMMCDDMKLDMQLFAPTIASQIKTQIEQHSQFADRNTEKEMLGKDSSDRRVVINLNIQVGNTTLKDQFEWDISPNNIENNSNSPERFAEILCSELGLGGEFKTAVAYSIRGQIAYHRHNVTESLPTLDYPMRLNGEEWGPSLEILTDAEMEKKIRDMDRNTRRMRRFQTSNFY